jgi:hypothetical protein
MVIEPPPEELSTMLIKSPIFRQME